MKLDIVVPFYNEEECLNEFVGTLKSSLDKVSGISYTYYFVDDGSTDRSPDILDTLAKSDERIHVIPLWENHGHQKALIAGLDQCRGDAVLMMDGDGQHPAETAVKLIQVYLQNPEFAVVQGVRGGRQQSLWKDWTSRFFYWIINKMVPETRIVPGSSDFRLLNSDALHLIRSYPDRHRNLRVLLASLKLPTVFIDYIPDLRLGGYSKYGWRRMVGLAVDGLFAFSSFPLRINLFLMLVSGFLGIGYAIYSLVVYLKGQIVPGWTSTIALIALLFCAMFGALAILSEYVSRIYEDVRQYPLYHIRPDRRSTKQSREVPVNFLREDGREKEGEGTL
ncbi:MAG: glycosyltransferase [Planctomycetes bacterium]|nr:glycosyltransferase [Planctomycetota bacterium]